MCILNLTSFYLRINNKTYQVVMGKNVFCYLFLFITAEIIKNAMIRVDICITKCKNSDN